VIVRFVYIGGLDDHKLSHSCVVISAGFLYKVIHTKILSLYSKEANYNVCYGEHAS